MTRTTRSAGRMPRGPGAAPRDRQPRRKRRPLRRPRFVRAPARSTGRPRQASARLLRPRLAPGARGRRSHSCGRSPRRELAREHGDDARDDERREEARHRRADSPVGRAQLRDEVRPPARARGKEPLVEREPRPARLRSGLDATLAPRRSPRSNSCGRPRASRRARRRRAARRRNPEARGSSGSSRGRSRARRRSRSRSRP